MFSKTSNIPKMAHLGKNVLTRLTFGQRKIIWFW